MVFEEGSWLEDRYCEWIVEVECQTERKGNVRKKKEFKWICGSNCPFLLLIQLIIDDNSSHK